MCGQGNNGGRSGGRGRGRTNQGGRGRRGRNQSGRSDRGNNYGRGGQRTNQNQKGRGGGCGRGRGRGDRGSWHGGWKPVTMAVSISTTSSEISSASTAKKNSNTKKITTFLPWPDPTTHYIAIEDEEQMLPVLIHWGKSERGMMKDQPPFRLQTIQNMLSNIQRTQSQSKSTTQHISLIQSLSFRRHQLKFLNPTYDMSSLRLGDMDIIKKSATKFEDCVETYLRSHKVPFLTEWEQKRKTRAAGMLDPPSPDFMLKDGHSVKLSLVVSYGNENTANNVNSEQSQSSGADHHPLVINWVEAKMFYGASSIPSGTPNAVGCVVPKMQQYVSLYGTGAIVFMYGCGSQLAQQLLELGVVALDGRCLDLERVEKHQKKWCADACGNILF